MEEDITNLTYEELALTTEDAAFSTCWNTICDALRQNDPVKLDSYDVKKIIENQQFVYFCINKIDPAPIIFVLETRALMSIDSSVEKKILRLYKKILASSTALSTKKTLKKNLRWAPGLSRANEYEQWADFVVKQGLLFRYELYKEIVDNFKRYASYNVGTHRFPDAAYNLLELTKKWKRTKLKKDFMQDCLVPAALFAGTLDPGSLAGEFWGYVSLQCLNNTDTEVARPLLNYLPKDHWIYFLLVGRFQIVDKEIDNLLDTSKKMLTSFFIHKKKIYSKEVDQREAESKGAFQDDTLGMKTIENFYNFSNNIEIRPFIFSGTLLGWARQRRLLAFDKDLDFGLFYTPESAGEIKKAIAESEKYDVLLDGRYNTALCDRETGIAFDIFWMIRKGIKVIQQVEIFKNFTLVFEYPHFDIVEIDFGGIKIAAPSEHEAILSCNYGEDWLTPDSEFNALIESPSIVNKNTPDFYFHVCTQIINYYFRGHPEICLRLVRFLWQLNSDSVQQSGELLSQIESSLRDGVTFRQ